MTDYPPPDEPMRPDELGALEELLSGDTVWADPPPELEDLVVAAITAEVEASPSPVAGSAPPRFGRPARWLAAVAAIAVAFGAGVWINRDDDQRPAPEGEEFALEVVDLAPDATGSVLVSELPNGVRLLLTVEDLPAAPEGQFYEAWLHTETEVVSAGTFHMRTGAGTVPLWAGVLTDQYPFFSITLEDEDGDPAPSGRFVMTTEVG